MWHMAQSRWTVYKMEQQANPARRSTDLTRRLGHSELGISAKCFMRPSLSQFELRSASFFFAWRPEDPIAGLFGLILALALSFLLPSFLSLSSNANQCRTSGTKRMVRRGIALTKTSFRLPSLCIASFQLFPTGVWAFYLSPSYGM